MKRLLVLVVALILYGSLFPWHFAAHHVPGGPVWYLLHRWDAGAHSYLVHDVAINIVLYIPLGLVAHFVFGSPFWPLLLAGSLSLTIELLQIYVPGRQAAIVDILANISGAAVGIAMAVFLRAIPSPSRPFRVHPVVAWALLVTIAAGLQLAPARNGFEWVPFETLLRGNPQSGLIVLAVKTICYGSAIGLFRLSEMAYLKATVIVAVVVGLVARSTTDPAIAALAGFVLATLFPGTETQSRSAE